MKSLQERTAAAMGAEAVHMATGASRSLRLGLRCLAKICAAAAMALAMVQQPADAQTRSRFEQEVLVGVQGGYNLSQVRFLHNDVSYSGHLGDLKYHGGAAAGLYVRYIAQKHFGIQLEADYLQAGWKEKWGNDATVGEVSFAGSSIERELDYLSIPLLAHIYFGGKHRAFLNLGPKVGFLIKDGDTKVKMTQEQRDIVLGANPNDPRLNEEEEESSIDYGLCIGLGYEAHLRKINISAEARWTYGLQDVFDHGRSDVYQRSNNQMFTFVLGVGLPLFRFHSN